MRPAPRRGAKVVPRTRKRRLGTILFFVGLLAVLGGAFGAGALAGRLSLRPSASLASAPKGGSRTEKPAPAPQPELTFYRELTAPLTHPPPPPKPVARVAPKPIEAARVPDAAAPEPPRAAELESAQAANIGIAAPRGEAARYTVQVAAYNVRAQAEALRARLASAGHDAYIAEGESGGVTRYRVRIGAYDTAEEARQAAVRIGAQAQVATYVTTR